MEQEPEGLSRRTCLNRASAVGASSAFTIVRPELVRGQRKALLKTEDADCGGRGTQAIADSKSDTENYDPHDAARMGLLGPGDHVGT